MFKLAVLNHSKFQAIAVWWKSSNNKLDWMNSSSNILAGNIKSAVVKLN